ncbi:MAG: serine/threonine protein kinase, partial [Gemmataceae bacterium]
MNHEQNQAKTIFLNALEIAATAERQAYVEAECRNDDALRHEVEELLRHQAVQGSFLEAPLQNPAATVDQAANPKRLGVVGPYKLLQQIGEGGMGTVFMAEQTEPIQRKVAVKIIKPGMDSRQ